MQQHPPQRSPYSLQVRERVVHMVEVLGYSYQQASAVFSGRPSHRTVGEIVRAARQNGGHAAEPQGRTGIKHHNRMNDLIAADELVDIILEDQQADLMVISYHMTQRMSQDWSSVAVSRALAELGFTLKKIDARAIEARPAQEQAFKDYLKVHYMSREMLVFIDEVSADDRVVNKSRAWALKGELAKCRTIFVRGQRFSTIAAISFDGVLCHRTVQGGATKEIFLDYFANEVVPLLSPYPGPNSVVILDNCAIHHKDVIKAYCQAVGAEVVFLPPYSPHLNPIEKMFCTCKQWLKTHAEYVKEVDPLVAIASCLDDISPEMCKNWITYIDEYSVEYA